ncbi:Na+/H+ antiporter NhaC [Porticoccaceae bacterium]|jgi:NhaC family Na+:H+ antiporter|nr:Na+/H+ antiporter NhaC [Porticoccaceae bacterium]MCT2533489.1 Na+/H+ antiporter NhaC [SAR92 clade bacterium H231]MBT6320430.1 Na+/H+ antiporter NhaC [Porticoccaceae bacterium]MBT7257487.1 Na+/H+ antiporter NhaC [Porticoccaceae bacterium]MBT7904746.1 Na+/H+ antiporter NhaC [Porticoccaceae bacterium]
MSKIITKPSLLDAITPVVILITMLAGTVYVFGLDSFGPNQVALIMAAAVAAMIGIKNGHSWKEIEQGMIDTIAVSLQSLLILLMVGALIGSWILSGTVPSMIYYGVQLMSPDYFYLTACLVCALLGFSIGSSWTVAGTLGIGLMGIAAALDLSLAASAGAIISGAYFGDKLSPLSETTNLAAAVTSNNLFDHIQHMLWTTIPGFLITLVLFFILGIGSGTNLVIDDIETLQAAMQETFKISPLMLIPMILLLTMAVKKLPALSTLICGTLAGCLFAAVFQWDTVIALANDSSLNEGAAVFKGLFSSMFLGYSSDTGNASLDALLSKGGMSSMLTTIGLVINAMAFGGAMRRTGLLERLVEAALSRVKSAGDLIVATVGTCIGTNLLAADQYLSIVIPGQMFVKSYEERQLSTINLARTLEDSGTLTSALVPWNTCGAYMSATLGVSTFMYAPFAFFNILCPIIAVIYGYSQIALQEHRPATDKQA